MANGEKERRPFRFLFKFAIFVGLAALITKVIASKKDEYYGLTESEARSKFESTLGPRIGEEKAAEIADQVIPKLKETGVIKPDPVEEAFEKTVEAVDEAVEAAADAIEEAVEEATS